MLYRDDFYWIEESISLLFASLWSEGQIFRWIYMQGSHNTVMELLSVWEIVSIFRYPFNLFEESNKRISLKIYSFWQKNAALPWYLLLCSLYNLLSCFPLIRVDKYFTMSCLFRIFFVWVDQQINHIYLCFSLVLSDRFTWLFPSQVLVYVSQLDVIWNSEQNRLRFCNRKVL